MKLHALVPGFDLCEHIWRLIIGIDPAFVRIDKIFAFSTDPSN